MGQQSLAYGQRADGIVRNFPIGASEIFKRAGGAFVSTDGSGRVEIATAAVTTIIGAHVLHEDFTASSTEGGSNVDVDLDLNKVYEIPINSGTYAATMRGETCDLSISSDKQGANLAASAIDIIEIVDAGFTNASGTVVSVLVKLFQKNLTRTGVV